ncbi:hypothetical protein JCM17823_12950 [Halorubrum gandharaense]
MALLKKLKEKLGFGGGDSERGGAETEVTVERESGESADAGTAAESDGDEGASASSAEEAEPPADEADEPVATETEAAASTESLVDEEEASVDPTEAAEPAEAAGPDSEDTEVAGDDATSVDSIKGIGPAYAERLADIGIDTVGDLAGADPAEVAEGTSVGEKRAARWIDRAKEF